MSDTEMLTLTEVRSQWLAKDPSRTPEQFEALPEVVKMRAMGEAVTAVADSEREVARLRAEGTTLRRRSFDQQEDLQAAQARADEITKPYREVLAVTAHQIAETAERLEAAERQLQAAREHEAHVFSERGPATA